MTLSEGVRSVVEGPVVGQCYAFGVDLAVEQSDEVSLWNAVQCRTKRTMNVSDFLLNR